ncbi:MAG: type II toxin-antitoxin system VapC family toxin [Gammaproteobacteria bacterium]|nr:type II toxin-antitoxin system VapC family toxin [Gammaproteobacteria bacterium]
MSYLLDTNVVSELSRARPAPAVTEWISRVPNEALFLSVLTLGELRKGVEALPRGARREALRLWLEQDLADWFGDRLLPVDAAVADRWGRLAAASGSPLAAIDSLLAATALQHDLRLVTRNVADFEFPALEVVNPWTG